MKIQIASDLHLEFPENREWITNNPLIPKGDILILAGDIIVDKYKKKAKKFYEKIQKEFKTIIEVPGNHEFYHGEVQYTYPNYYSKISENHFKLNNKAIVIDNTKFIVSTLWSFVSKDDEANIESCMNDYHIITKKDGFDYSTLKVKDTNRFFENSLAFIKEELKKEFKGNIIVVTHHLPSFKVIGDKYKGSSINSAFATDLDDLIIKNPQIKLWIHGHSHNFDSRMIGKTRVIRNPLGYVPSGEQNDFKRSCIFDI